MPVRIPSMRWRPAAPRSRRSSVVGRRVPAPRRLRPPGVPGGGACRLGRGPIGMLPSGAKRLEVFRRPSPASSLSVRGGAERKRRSPHRDGGKRDGGKRDGRRVREGPASWEETVIEDDPFTAPPPPERRLPAASPVDAAPDDAVAAAPRKRKRIEQSVLVEMQSGVGLL